ncbi:MAG: hypothetical protein KIT73_16585 [Burkholderiales bacterium]|nr:hypothetical protein [Burkholderiales bacterium]
MAASAQTPWERYLNDPVAANAAQVQRAEYSPGTESGDTADRLWEDLLFVENQVQAGDRAAFRLMLRLRQQFTDYSQISLLLDSAPGAFIRVQPKAYLEDSRQERAVCPGTASFSERLENRLGAQVRELEARLRALRSVSDPKLREARDRCVQMLDHARSELIDVTELDVPAVVPAPTPPAAAVPKPAAPKPAPSQNPKPKT